MAKIYEETILIKLSRLVKDSSVDVEQTINDKNLEAVEQIVQELVGSDVVVEVEKITN